MFGQKFWARLWGECWRGALFVFMVWAQQHFPWPGAFALLT